MERKEILSHKKNWIWKLIEKSLKKEEINRKIIITKYNEIIQIIQFYEIFKMWKIYRKENKRLKAGFRWIIIKSIIKIIKK